MAILDRDKDLIIRALRAGIDWDLAVWLADLDPDQAVKVWRKDKSFKARCAQAMLEAAAELADNSTPRALIDLQARRDLDQAKDLTRGT